MPQIYGYAFHSPLILQNIVPYRDHYPIYLDHRWQASDLSKNVTPMLTEAYGKTIILLAGSLSILQSFLKTFSDIDQPIKVILFEFPGLITPFKDPELEWIDCDHQVGGAWQTTKTKLSNFETLIRNQTPLDSKGKDLIFRMVRVATKDRISEIEKFHEYMPQNYKELIDYDMTDAEYDNKAAYDAAKDNTWKKKTFVEVVNEFLINVPKSKRQVVVDLILEYQLNLISKKDYNIKLKPFIENSLLLKKTVIIVRKWMDDAKHGRCLYQAYLDYISNLERRCWKSILDDHGFVDELDLLVVIAKQNRDTSGLFELYEEDLKEIKELPSNMNPPEMNIKWHDGTLHYHKETPNLIEVFDL